jgi:hypothetical protein
MNGYERFPLVVSLSNHVNSASLGEAKLSALVAELNRLNYLNGLNALNPTA